MTPGDLSLFVSTIVVLTAIVMAALVVLGVRRLARRPGVLQVHGPDGPADSIAAARVARVDRWVVGIIVATAAVALIVTFALGGQATIVVPLYLIGLSAAVYGLVTMTASGRQLLAAVPQTWLIGAQTYRMAGGVFLIAASYDALPAYFAIPAGWGDFFVGLTAPLVAFWWARGFSFARPAAWVWNLLGLFDLVVAVGIGTALFAQPAAAIFGGTPAWLERAALGFQPFGAAIFPVGSPLTLVPLFLVPMAIVLHLLSLHKLVTERKPLHLTGAAALGTAVH